MPFRRPSEVFAAHGDAVEVLGEWDPFPFFNDLHPGKGAVSPKAAQHASPGQRPGFNRQKHPKP